MHDMILEMLGRVLIPATQLFGAYILFHGHLSPGGGFSGGTIIGASFILYSLVYRFSASKHRLKHETSMWLEVGGALIYVGAGLVGILFGRHFLTNQGVFPIGEPGRLWSSGMILLVTLGIGAKVAGTVFKLFQELLEGGAEQDGHH
ncbi:MAG: Na(+)/H(+) antiporter subunit B [Firmicutes bacterium]|nr:Na(+)/H(+) antiporter subunit B [candidate division NPL-UPA2 bacterium]